MDGERRRALNAAYRMLARRDHSVHEITASLLKKGFGAEAVSSAVQQCAARGYLDDRKFAGAYARSLARNKKAGPRYIKDALKKKGVSAAFAGEAAAEVYENSAAEERMVRLLAKKKGASIKKDLSPLARKKRIFDYLSRRGFSYDAIMKALRGAGDEE